MHRFHAPPSLNIPTCAVCDAPVHDPMARWTHGRGDKVCCTSSSCRWVIAEAAKMDRHRAAGFLRLQRDLAQQRHEEALRQEAFERAQARRERRQNLRQLARLRKAQPHLAPAVAINLPCGVRPEVPMPHERRERYRDHLVSILTRARAGEGLADWAYEQSRGIESRLQAQDSLLAARPDLGVASESLCRLCEGGCCTSGAEHAYLTEYDMLRLLATHPDWDDDQVVAAYLGHVTEQSRAGSCINHTAQGCALPRALRSVVCNAYYCDELKKLHARPDPGDAAPPLLAIQREYHHWNRNYQGPHARIIRISLLRDAAVESLPVRAPARTGAKRGTKADSG